MKKYLISPELNWYRANMHCHSTVSDGYYSPEAIKEAYKNMGYSIVAYTDHEIIRTHNELTDDEFELSTRLYSRHFSCIGRYFRNNFFAS